jgi:FtsP/CotA-like multicopper oxidase with cupredoxin domain
MLRRIGVSVMVLCGVWGCDSSSDGHGGHAQFVDPPSLYSENGVLELTLESAVARVTVGSINVNARVFNGQYTPPIFRLQQGDRLIVHQVNHLTNLPVNLHTHGLVTTPELNGDNVFVIVDPNTTFDTDIPIPLTHESGMFWYHPHVHPYVNQEISQGMSSAIIIGDLLAPFPELANIKERVMIFKDLKLNGLQPVDNPDPDGPTMRTINGVYQPEITIAPGELQFWRMGNLGANIFYDLAMDGVTFNIIAVDGNLQNQLTTTDELVIPPGSRYEVLVRGPDKPGKYELKTKAFNTGPDGDAYPEQLMATLKVEGPPVPNPIPLPSVFPSVPDLRLQPVDNTRTVVFNDTSDPNVFVIDDQIWDRDRVDQTVMLGSLEQWTIENASAEFHVFHIHQGDFQVTEINGVPQPFTGYQDVVNLPVATSAGPGSVTFLLKFDPPIIVGEYVYHCHIVQHEDQGMMANVVVEDALARAVQGLGPPDLIASALTPATDNYWCKG